MTSAKSNEQNQWYKRSHKFVSEHRYPILLLIVAITAVFFRLWAIDSTPPGVHGDEAFNGLDGLSAVEDGNWKAFYEANNGREGLFIWFVGIFSWMFGTSVASLHLTPALIGIGSVVATFLATREWYDRRTALLASLFVAAGSWSVHMSRLGFRAILVTLFIPLIAWTLAKAFRSQKWQWWVASGACIGLGFYTYLSFRVFAIVLAAVAVRMIVMNRDLVKRSLKGLGIAIATFLVVLAPLGLQIIQEPSVVLGARTSVSVFDEEVNEGNPVTAFAKSVGESALMFNFIGDENARHNLPGAPMLNAFVGAMFILGVILAIKSWRDWRTQAIMGTFAVMMLPAVLTAEGIPHALRSIGVVPIVYVLAAIGLSELIRRWQETFPRNHAVRISGMIVVFIVIALSVSANWYRYFVAYANSPEVYEAFEEPANAMAAQIDALEPTRATVVLYPHQYVVVDYLLHDGAEHNFLHPDDIAPESIESDTEYFVDEDSRVRLLESVQQSGKSYSEEVIYSAKRANSITHYIVRVE